MQRLRHRISTAALQKFSGYHPSRRPYKRELLFFFIYLYYCIFFSVACNLFKDYLSLIML